MCYLFGFAFCSAFLQSRSHNSGQCAICRKINYCSNYTIINLPITNHFFRHRLRSATHSAKHAQQRRPHPKLQTKMNKKQNQINHRRKKKKKMKQTKNCAPIKINLEIMMKRDKQANRLLAISVRTAAHWNRRSICLKSHGYYIPMGVVYAVYALS